jgi:Flp pilus assembly protein TadG
MSALRSVLRLVRDHRAATAVAFALTITPIIGFVALAFDVGSAVWARSQLDMAADAAALTAATTGANDFAANPNTSLQPAQQAGINRFNAQAGAMPGVKLTSLSVSVSPTGGTINAVVSYTATYTTRFAGLFGFPTLPASGSAAVARTNSPYFAINILMDMSSSMAIPATETGMEQLGSLVGELQTGTAPNFLPAQQQEQLYTGWAQSQNCAFGCHFAANNQDFYGLARDNQISLRIDILIQAVQNVISTIASSPVAAQFTFGLYGFNWTFNTIFSPSSNLTAAEAAAQAIAVPVTTNGGQADTNIPLALQTLSATTPPSGNGSTASAPRRFLFIVTDGVADYCSQGYTSSYGCVGGNTVGTTNSSPRVITPLNPSLCAALKAEGVTIMTLYIQYFPLIAPYDAPNGNAFYISNVQPFQSSLAPNLQACASSPSYAFVASDAASIGAALQAMVQAAMSTPARFTQ